MIDLRLDPVTGDLDISNNTLHTTAVGLDSVSQRVRIRLRFFYKEWILDRSAGTKWFEIVLVKGIDKFAADREIRRVIQETEGILSLDSFTSEIDVEKRIFSVKFSATTIGSETLNLVLDNVLN